MAEGFTFAGSPFSPEVVDPAQLDIVMPMCELPVPLEEVLAGVDATILTHLHPDHFDMAPDGSVGAKLDKSLPIFFRKERSAVSFATPKWAPRPIMIACGNGASELMTTIAMPVVAMLYNFQLLRFAGADGVAAWGVVMYLAFVFVSIFLGYSMAVTPVMTSISYP